jgi:hypothetical protein
MQFGISPEALYEQTKQQALEINDLRLQLAAVLGENRALRARVEELTPVDESTAAEPPSEPG